MLYDKTQVMKFLPHRDPFLFVDTVLEVILPEILKGQKGPYKIQDLVGGTSVCTFRVDKSVKVLEGHFPGNPILPGVVQVEMMAQAASFLAASSLGRPIEEIKIDVALLGIDTAKFRRPIIPPMDLEIQSKLVKLRGHIHIYECQIRANGELMSETTVMASIKFEEGK